jgi:hypothetical protein
MAYIGKFKLGGSEYNLIDCQFALRRDLDEKGNPKSKLYSDLINVTIEAAESTYLIEYILTNQSRPLDGSITIINISQEKNAKEIIFRNSFIVEYSENINLNNMSKQQITIRLSAKIIRIGTAEHADY